jgi:hypothetical protein
MKRLSLMILISFLIGLTGFQKIDKKEKKARERLEMGQLIQGEHFRFVARSAHSELGSFDHLSYNYDMVFDSLHVKAYLPYYGRAYSVTYGSEGGVKFDLKAQKTDQIWNEKKKLFIIKTELNNSEDSYSIYLTAGLDGYADLRINFRDRSWMSYYGTIEKIEH